MNLSIFDHDDYKAFLKKALEGRGLKLEFAKSLNCQSAYVSRILSNQAELSLEQAVQATSFFEMSEQEKDYFIMLVHHNKAGSISLKKYYQSKIKAIRKQRDEVSTKLQERSKLSEEEENIVFSSWLYNAFSVGVRIPSLQTRKDLSRHFKIELIRTNEVVDFLISLGLIREENGKLQSGPTHIHQKKESPNATRAQINWRLRALDSMNHPNEDDLHFWGVYSLSESAVVEIRRILIQSLEQLDDVVRPAKDETLQVLCIDWFKI